MALLQILEYPDPRLRTRASPVVEFDAALKRLAEDMLETMYAAPGIGLAATQVNVHQRMLVCDVSEDKSRPLVIINPEIVEHDGDQEMQEGCLSVPGEYETVHRAGHIVARYQDLDGRPQQIQAEGLLAVCIQHEMDHLEGKLFVDYLSSLKRQRIRKRLEKQHRKQATA